MNDDDRSNMFDLWETIRGLHEARQALQAAMAGDDWARELFLFKLGFARGKLGRVCDRVYPAKETSKGEPPCP